MCGHFLRSNTEIYRSPPGVPSQPPWSPASPSSPPPSRTVFAQATGVRYSRTKAPHQGAWTFALALFALASAALATAASTGWDKGTFRVFYLLGAVLNVPWLALGTVYLLWGRALGNRVRTGLILFTGIASA